MTRTQCGQRSTHYRADLTERRRRSFGESEGDSRDATRHLLAKSEIQELLLRLQRDFLIEARAGLRNSVAVEPTKPSIVSLTRGYSTVL